MRICISYFPPEYPAWLESGPLRYFFSRLGLYLRQRRNPRSAEYMKALCDHTFGKDYTMLPAEDIASKSLTEAEDVVLLWPDGNGYGWGRTEKKVLRALPKEARLHVLNGRRRYFRFGPTQRVGYMLRRAAERFWVGEMAMTLVFIFATPFLIAWDKAKGRS